MINFLSLNSSILEDVLVPLGICVILPCIIVFLVMWARRNEINKKAEVALKAIEAGAELDPNLFGKPADKTESRKDKLFETLRSGLICAGLGLAFVSISALKMIQNISASNYSFSLGVILLFIGVAMIVAYFIGRKQFAAEIKAEEEKIGK